MRKQQTCVLIGFGMSAGVHQSEWSQNYLKYKTRINAELNLNPPITLQLTSAVPRFLMMFSMQDYAPTLPAYLLEIVDPLIKHDRCRALLAEKPGAFIDDYIQDYERCLARENEEYLRRERDRYMRKNHVWLFLDHRKPNNNIIKVNSNGDSQFFTQPKAETDQEALVPNGDSPNNHGTNNKDPIQAIEGLQNFNSAIYSLYLNEETIKAVEMDTVVKDLQILRMRAEINHYADPNRFIAQVRGIISWNMIFRTRSYRAVRYLSDIYDEFILILNRKSFSRRFQEKKDLDMNRLYKYELELKVNCTQWPSIPTDFREYEHIQNYIPVPQKRATIIQEKLRSSRLPQKCPPDCPCLSTKEVPYCEFSLIEGTWVSSCKNRNNRIECNHQDPEEQKRCRNSEISKKQRKSCRTHFQEDGKQYDIEECLIWGIDLFTRKNIFYCLPDKDIDYEKRQLFDNTELKYKFIENALLKAVNFGGSQGYNMHRACKFILKDETGMFSAKDKEYATLLAEAITSSPSSEAFRIHSKGKGARCLKKEGIPQSEFIVEYFGEIYQLWRWYERQDITKKFMKDLNISEQLPDFYNIYLQKHKDELDGYDMLVVDPISKGNFSSRFSHSCNPNCGTITTVSNGKYYIGMYALRKIEYGEQLTFDYCSVTESSNEHRIAICLCGMKECRGKYLQMSNSKAQNFVLDNEYCFQARTASLLRSLEPLTKEDVQLLSEHNIRNNMLDGCPGWLKKWSALVLRFIVEEGPKYKKGVLEQLVRNRKDLLESEIDPNREQLFAEVSKSDLYIARHQNLITTIDKLKYYLIGIEDEHPPLTIISDEECLDLLWESKKAERRKISPRRIAAPSSDNKAMLEEMREILARYNYTDELQVLQQLDRRVMQTANFRDKLFVIRFYILLLSHILRNNHKKTSIPNTILADILHFYAFTHTYFVPYNYKKFESEPIVISPKQFLNFSNKKEDLIKKKDLTEKKSYPSQFVWGQLVAWYKQTIAQPQASLSQDRRGTLTYPTLSTLMQLIHSYLKYCFQLTRQKLEYPFEGNNRTNFLKAIYERPAASWPPDKCQWSYRNERKTYGTFLFENYFNINKFKALVPPPGVQPIHDERKLLIGYVIKTLDKGIDAKFSLFGQVERLVHGRAYHETDAQLRIAEDLFGFRNGEELLKRASEGTDEKKLTKKAKKSK